MTLAEKLGMLKESELFKLVFEGRVLGLRVKIYNVNSDKFEYYDFEAELLHDKQMIRFVNSVQKTLGTIALRRDGNGSLVSDEELKGGIKIAEFENEADAVRVLSQLQKIYEAKG